MEKWYKVLDDLDDLASWARRDPGRSGTQTLLCYAAALGVEV